MRRPRRADVVFAYAEGRGVRGDDRDVGDIGAVDEECAGKGVMKGGRRLVAGASAHEFTGLESEPGVDVAARRLDRDADLPREHAQATLDLGPLFIAKGLWRSLQRRIGVQLERKPTRRNTKLPCCFLDPDRAEIAEWSNDIRPDEKRTRLAHDMEFPQGLGFSFDDRCIFAQMSDARDVSLVRDDMYRPSFVCSSMNASFHFSNRDV